MVQINQDYYEDLTPESLNKLMDDLAAGRPVKAGSQIGRISSEPKDAINTLTDESLFDGSRIGAWRKRFEQTDGTGEEGVKKDEAASTEARVKDETKPARPQAGRANESNAVDGPAERASAGETPVKPEDRAQARDAKVPSAQDPAVAEDKLLRTEPPQHPATIGAGDDVPEGENPEARADAAGTRPKGLDAPRDDRRDDLTKIKGIGPVNQRRLNDLVIWHYDQIAAWSPQEVAWIGAYLAFPGRIDRENWVGQASDLAGSKG